MRFQAEPEQMTRLLIVKEKAYAELDEMSRMAISVLTDEGWKFSRIGLDMRVQVTSTPMIEQMDPAHEANGRLLQKLAAAQIVISDMQKELAFDRSKPWIAALVMFAAVGLLNRYNLAEWNIALFVGCIAGFLWTRFTGKGAA
jgi:hypothetical protein